MNIDRSAAVAASLVLALQAGAGVTPLSEWNLIVRNDLALSTSEVDGSALIGGSLLGGTSNYAVQGVTASSGDALAVGGFLDSGVTVNLNNSGNFRIGSLANQLGTVNLNGGIAIGDASVASTAATYGSLGESLSDLYSMMTPNGAVDGAGNLSASPVMYDGQSVAVYNVTQSQWNGLGQFNLNLGSADSVIINFIHDGSGIVNLNAPPNIIGGFNQANSSRILWNFGDATQVTVNNSFNGALLAPYASLSITGGGVNGSVLVDSIAMQGAEIRGAVYTGYTPAIPVPGVVSALVLGVPCVVRRRRRA